MLIKFLLSYFLVLITTNSFAVTIEFIGPCDEKPFMRKTLSSVHEQTLGELTINLLEKEKIAYLGTEKGLNQVLNSPIGLDALEVIKDDEMMAYGWCFEVDGKIPELYPDEIRLDGKFNHIKWFYGYAHYLKGIWISQCQKSYLRKSPFVCKT